MQSSARDVGTYPAGAEERSEAQQTVHRGPRRYPVEEATRTLLLGVQKDSSEREVLGGWTPRSHLQGMQDRAAAPAPSGEA